MNKSGHIAFGSLLGSTYMILTTHTEGLSGILQAAITIGAVTVGSLAPDIDHKTSTASNFISPFPVSLRRRFRFFGAMFLIIGLFLFAYRLPSLTMVLGFIHLPLGLTQNSLLIAGAGILMMLLARLRSLILLGVGAWMLYAYWLHHLHWFVAFAAIALAIMPLVRHRGVIHTPEFAIVLTIGVHSLLAHDSAYIAALGLGFVIGWWAHLAGDLFGSEGIHSLFVPKFRIALQLFRNGGTAERCIGLISWVASLLIWALMLQNPDTGLFSNLVN
jgi:hypothetical protein